MHKEGHMGAALIGYAPMGAAAFALGFDTLALGGAAAAVALSMVPDVDMRVPLLTHRGPTHTVWFALGMAVLLGILGAFVGWQGAESVPESALAALGLGTFGFALGVASVGSHLVVDALTPAGIRPLAPWRSRRYSYDLVTSESLVGNYGLLAAGVVVSVGALALGSAVAGLSP